MLISPAYAQAGGAPAGFDLISLMPLVLIFVVFYFLLIRPQQKKMKTHREMIGALKRGDKVLTGGGIIGTVVKVEDGELLVEVAKDVRVRVARGTISDVLSKPGAGGGAEPAGRRGWRQDRPDGAAVRQEIAAAMLRFPGWKIALILGVCLVGLVLSLPNLFPREQMQRLPDWLPHEQINLGLDLQGGSHLLLEVDIRAVVEERLETLVDDIRSILRPARIGYRGLGVRGDAATLTLTDPASAGQAVGLLDDLNPNPLAREIEVVEGEAGRIDVRLTASAVRELQDAAVRQSLEIVRRRIDEVGTREPTIQRQGENRILVQVPGEKDPESIKRLLGQTAKLTFHLVDLETPLQQAVAGNLPPGSMLLPSDEDGQSQVVVRKRVEVSGESLIDAQPSFQQNEPVVSFRFDTAGGRKFGNVTREHVGELLAIVLDDKVISSPRIREPILGGSGVISGSFTVETANELAVLLRAGALPAPLEIVEERSVGPDLGAGFDRRRRDRGRGRAGARDGADGVLLWPVRGRGLRRAARQSGPDDRRAVGAAGDADAARHRRHRAHDRHGGRRQRADLRADSRGGPRRALADQRDRRRLSARRCARSSTPTSPR